MVINYSVNTILKDISYDVGKVDHTANVHVYRSFPWNE